MNGAPAVAELRPKPNRIAQLLRLIGSNGGERRNAFAALERLMASKRITWSDIGNAFERDAEEIKYTEIELREFAQTARAEGVEAGIKIGLARNSNGGDHLMLPKPNAMAQFCHDRLGQLKDDKQRDFITDVWAITQRGSNLSKGRLGYLASVYIQIGGRI
jgi:hypothetical protein